VTNEGDLEVGETRQQVEPRVECVGALALSGINEEYVQVGVEVGETFATNIVGIDVHLKKTIEMIME
jgi:hypothetical protein